MDQELSHLVNQAQTASVEDLAEIQATLSEVRRGLRKMGRAAAARYSASVRAVERRIHQLWNQLGSELDKRN